MEVGDKILFKVHDRFVSDGEILKIFEDGRILVDTGDYGGRGLDYIKESDIIEEYGK